MPRQTQLASEPAAIPGEPKSHWKLEAALVLLVVLPGCALRLAYPSRMAIEHFDEGVYASNRWFSDPDGFPNRHLYAPPLLPSLIEWSFILFGPSNFAAMLPSLIAGCLTMPMTWWVVRTWFSPRAALAVAILVAGSGLHIAFSRSALTDTLLLFWLIAAVGAGSAAFRNRSWVWAIVTGLLTGFAWWTKYNGWLPLAILGSGGVAWSILPGRPLAAGVLGLELPESPPLAGVEPAGRWRRLAWVLGLWSIMAGVAAAIWAPCLWSLQSHGGYAAVAANHRGYIVGWNGWLNSFWQQNVNLWTFNGWMSLASVPLAVLLPALLPLKGMEGFTWNVRELLLRICIAGLLTCAMIIPGIALLVLGGVELLVWLVLNLSGRVLNWRPAVGLGIWLVTAWFSGLLLATPHYTPYARLILPLWLAGTIAVSLLAIRLPSHARLVVAFLRGAVPPRFQPAYEKFRAKRRGVISSRIWVWMTSLFGVAGVAVLIAIAPYLNAKGIPGWEDRTTCQTIANEVITDIEADLHLPKGTGLDRFAVYAYGEPAIMFQMRLAGAPLVVPISHLKFANPDAAPPGVPQYVLIGPQARRTHDFPVQMATAFRRLHPVKSYRLTSSKLVESDTHAEYAKAFTILKGSSDPGYTDVVLYRVLSQSPGQAEREIAAQDSW